MRKERTALLGLVVIVLLSGCTYTVPMNTQMVDLTVTNRIPLHATLLIPDTLRSYTFKGNPQSYTGGANEFIFPLGAELEKATHDAFSQVFQQVSVVREPLNPKDVEMLIEPEIIKFHFRFDQLSYAGFAVAAVSKIQVKVTMTDGTVRVWAREAESPEQRSGPWVIGFDFDEHLGKAASKALVFTLKEIATEASKASELWALADKVRTEKGKLETVPGDREPHKTRPR